MSLRVAVLTNDYPPHQRGGAGRIAEMQVRMLEASGMEVRVWRPDVPWLQRQPLNRMMHHLLDLRARHDIVAEVLLWQPDILISHNLTGCGFATPRRIQRQWIPWIHILHDVQLFQPSGKLRQPEIVSCWQWCWARLRRRALGQPTVILSPTRWLVDIHLRRGFRWPADTIEILPNPSPAISLEHRELHRPLRLLFVGRLGDDKGARGLHRLVRELREHASLWMVGEGPGIHHFQDFPRWVTCFGHLSSEQVLARMKEADVLLLPSRIAENQPTVILEAASVGLPVIASNFPGIRETLGTAGLLCPPEERSAWAMAIQNLQDPEFYQHQVKQMLALAEQHQPKEYADRLIALLTKMTTG